MSDMTVAEVLTKAADLIEPQGRWTQGVFSRNADGTADLGEDMMTASEPVCWCALGALAQVAGADTQKFTTFAGTNPEPQAQACKVLASIVGFGVEDWNDAPERTQAEVVQILREAAERAKGGDQ